MKDRKPYEKPAVIFEKDLEAMAAYCGDGPANPYVEAQGNCKSEGPCLITFS